MPKRQTLLISLATAAVLGALVFTLAQPSGPTYRGRSLSHWLEAPRNAESENAVQAIGTNAFPFLLRWIRYEPPPWRKKYAALAAKYNYYTAYRLFNGREPDKAMLGFAILATNSTPPIPELVNIMRDSTNPEASRRATFALAFLGQQGLPLLTQALSDPDPARRTTVITAITSACFSGASTNACLLALLSATTDTDLAVRRRATNAILRIDPEVFSTPMPH